MRTINDCFIDLRKYKTSLNIKKKKLTNDVSFMVFKYGASKSKEDKD